MAVTIEREDQSSGQAEGLRMAADTMLAAAAIVKAALHACPPTDVHHHSPQEATP